MCDIRPLSFQKDSIRLAHITSILTVFFFFIFFLLTFLRIPVSNYDFWWHLATGKHIAETKSLPREDPFSYTSLGTPLERKAIILKGNWLAEVIFYKVYHQWDIKGIIILRSVLLLLFLFYVFLNIRKQEVSFLVSLILLGGVFLVAKTYSGERPQLFTFFVFSAVFYLLEDFRINKSRKVFLIPVLVMLLSNIHPGYVVCILLVSLYLAGEGIGYFIKRDYGGSGFKSLLIIWGLTIIFSMLNPNGAIILTRLFSFHGEHTRGIIEYKPTFFLYLNKLTPVNYSYIIFLVFSLLGLRYIKKIGPAHMLLLSVFTFMSLISIRYVIFYMCVAPPVLARIIINLRDEKVFGKLIRTMSRGEGFLKAAACILGIFLVLNAIPSFARYEFKADTAYSTPESAADFLGDVKIRGNMFNEYGFGGYLIWRLYPEKRVFIDGRALEPDVYNEYYHVVSASESAHKSWKDIIKKYNITYIIMPPLQHHGSIYPLVEKLLDSEDWGLIYTDHLSLIFLRYDSENPAVIKKYAKDKREGFNTIIVQASARAMQNKTSPYFLITLGKVFFKMGRTDDAEKAFLMAYGRDPDNEQIKSWLKKLKETREKTK